MLKKQSDISPAYQKKGDRKAMKPIPLELKETNMYVAMLHRHLTPIYRDKFRLGAVKHGKLVGVIQVGRPVARCLDNGLTLEVLRLCSDGTRNVCSFLYTRAARIASEMGYAGIITYILDSESGASLRAAGWTRDSTVRGHSWSCPSRPRSSDAPMCDKQRWSKKLSFKTSNI